MHITPIEKMIPNFLELFDLVVRGDQQTLLQELNMLEEMTLDDEQLGEHTALDLVLEAVNPAGKTLLHTVVEQPHISIPLLELLLLKGAPINALDSEHHTVIHRALQSENTQQIWDVVQILLAWDVNLSLRTNANATTGLLPSQLAQTQQTRDPELFRKLTALLRIRQEWQEELQGFRFNRVIDLIQKAYPEIEPAAGQNKLLLIGRTGAGKSTLLNILNGTDYGCRREVGTGRLYAEPLPGTVPPIAKVGQTMISETLYPQVVSKQDLDYVYCDLAGLFDSRGDEERICAASGVQLLTRLPGEIKGLLVVLDFPSFFPRAAEFRATAVALAKMVRENPAVMRSVGFVITQVPENCTTLTVDGLIGTIRKELLPHYRARLRAGTLAPEDRALLFMLEQICALGSSHMKVVNLADCVNSRREIENFVRELPLQNPRSFDFVSHDGSQECFNEFMFTIANKFLTRKARLAEQIPSELANLQDSERGLKTRIAELEQQLVDKEAEMKAPYDATRIESEIVRLRMQITNNEKIIKNKIQEACNVQAELDTLARTLLEKNNEARIPMGEKNETFVDIKEHRLVHQFPHPIRRLDCNYRGYGTLSCETIKPKPIPGQSIDDFDGALCSHIDHAESMTGYVEYLFKASEGLTEAHIEAFTTNSLRYAADIRQLQTDIPDRENRKSAAERERRRLEQENLQLQQDINRCELEKAREKGQKELRDERLADQVVRARQAIVIAKSDLATLQEAQMKLNAESTTIQLEFEICIDLFKIVYHMSHILDLGEHNECIPRFWQEFALKYPELVVNPEEIRQTQRHGFVDSSANLFRASAGREAPVVPEPVWVARDDMAQPMPEVADEQRLAFRAP